MGRREEWLAADAHEPAARAAGGVLRFLVNEVLARKEEARMRVEELEGKLALEPRLRQEVELRLSEALAEIERLERS